MCKGLQVFVHMQDEVHQKSEKFHGGDYHCPESTLRATGSYGAVLLLNFCVGQQFSGITLMHDLPLVEDVGAV